MCVLTVIFRLSPFEECPVLNPTSRFCFVSLSRPCEIDLLR